MSDAHCLLPRRTDLEDAEIEAAAVELGVMHWVEQANRTLVAATKEVHRLTLLLEEREATIAALLAKPKLRVVREDELPSWMETAK
jgi:hypothetical protein